eukprot:12426689-Karenia_brevis.AAC.1
MQHGRWALAVSKPNFWKSGNEAMGKRRRGRPRQRWEDQLNSFSKCYGYEFWMDFAMDYANEWDKFLQEFQDYFLNDSWNYFE